MSDMVSRQAVLKLLSAMPPEEATTKAMLIQSVKQMDAAQPEKRTDERTETHACDCISRQAAIDEANAWLLECLGVHKQNRSCGLIRRLEDLPSAQLKSYREGYQAGFNEGYQAGFKDAQPEQRWIPCNERLPDRFGKMLVTFIPAAGTLWTCVIIANYSDLMGIAKPCFWIGNVGKNDFANITSRVVAWMPLPEPYKGDDK